jgi:hypothetical protein
MAKGRKERTAPAPPAVPRPKAGRICADFGGKGHDGTPCHAPVKSTPCRFHTHAADAALQAKKTRCVELLSEGRFIREVARELDVHEVTLLRWRHADPEFAATVMALAAENDESRTQIVEETMYARIIAGKAHPAETIFWLKNRAPGRWKDKRERAPAAPGPHAGRGSCGVARTAEVARGGAQAGVSAAGSVRMTKAEQETVIQGRDPPQGRGDRAVLHADPIGGVPFRAQTRAD